MDYVYFYGSSVRMGHKVYIIPILLARTAAAAAAAERRTRIAATAAARNLEART